MTWALSSPDGHHVAMPGFSLSNVWEIQDLCGVYASPVWGECRHGLVLRLLARADAETLTEASVQTSRIGGAPDGAMPFPDADHMDREGFERGRSSESKRIGVRRSDKRPIAEHFAVHGQSLPELEPSWNVAPQTFQPILRPEFANSIQKGIRTHRMTPAHALRNHDSI